MEDGERRKSDGLKKIDEDPVEALLARGELFQQDIRDAFARYQKTVSAFAVKASRIDDLEEENSRLKEQLAVALEQQLSSAAQNVLTSVSLSEHETSSPQTVATQEATVPYKDYAILAEKYNNLNRQLQESKKAWDVMYRKYHKSKKNIQEWHNFLKRHNVYEIIEQQRQGTDRPQTPRLLTSVSPHSECVLGDATEPTGELEKSELHEDVEAMRSSPPLGQDLPVPVNSSRVDLSEAADTARHDGAAEESVSLHDPTMSHRGVISSSQTTQDETSSQAEQPQPPIQPLDNDDEEPVVVSTRALKRKHQDATGNGRFSVYEDATANLPVNIKEEPQSSPITTRRPPHLLNRISTLDLDEIGDQIDTPRKRRRFAEMLRESQLRKMRLSQIPLLHHERSASVPLGFDEFPDLVDSTSQELQDEIDPLEVPDSDPIVAPGEIESASWKAAEVGKHALATRSPENPRKIHALRPLSTNARIPSSDIKSRPQRSRKHRDEDRGVNTLHYLAEDGEGTCPDAASPATKSESRRRLHNLLQAPTPEKPTITAPRTPATSRPSRATPRASTKKPSTATPQPKSKPSSRSKKTKTPDQLPTPQSATQTAFKRPRLEPATTSRSPRSSLRSRPLERLSLADFKVNPRANQGINEAFNEVVRNREARRCLPGCTDPTCCGPHFRALVEAGVMPTIPRSLFDESQEGETDDDRLLKYHLGRGYDKERVAVMPDVQQQELLLEAKTKLLADQHGKHRQAYERRKTPPGFWRTDMPSTQEIEKDREEAKKMERKTVEERWREAMREGGRWLFRDE